MIHHNHKYNLKCLLEAFSVYIQCIYTKIYKHIIFTYAGDFIYVI